MSRAHWGNVLYWYAIKIYTIYIFYKCMEKVRKLFRILFYYNKSKKKVHKISLGYILTKNKVLMLSGTQLFFYNVPAFKMCVTINLLRPSNKIMAVGSYCRDFQQCISSFMVRALIVHCPHCLHAHG